MVRIHTAVQRRAHHKKILKANKGFRGTKSKLLRVAKEAALHAGSYAFAGRKQRKQQKRSLWISQISAAARQQGVTYSRFIENLQRSNIQIDRKILAELANSAPEVFEKIVKQAAK